MSRKYRKYPYIFREGFGFFLCESWGNSTPMTPLVNFLRGCAMAGALTKAWRDGYERGHEAGMEDGYEEAHARAR